MTEYWTITIFFVILQAISFIKSVLEKTRTLGMMGLYTTEKSRNKLLLSFTLPSPSTVISLEVGQKDLPFWLLILLTFNIMSIHFLRSPIRDPETVLSTTEQREERS